METGLWVTMCQCRLINCNKHTPLVRNADVGDDTYMGAKGIWEISVLPVQFFYEPKTAPKIKVL